MCENNQTDQVSRFEVERRLLLHDNETGCCIEVGGDQDSLNLVEVKVMESGVETPYAFFSVFPEQAKLLAEMLHDAACGVLERKSEGTHE